MRKFRTAAVAAATAAVVSISGISVASAQSSTELQSSQESAAAQPTTVNDSTEANVKYDFGTEVKDSAKELTDLVTKEENRKTLSSGNPLGLSSRAGDLTEKDRGVSGEALLGQEVDENAPAWAQIWRDGTYVALITAVLGGLIGAYNWAVYNGFTKHIFG